MCFLMALSERRSTISASRALPTTSFGGADAVAESGDLLGGGLIDVSKAVVKREAEAAVSGVLEARLALSSLSLLRAPAILSALRCAHAPPVRHPRHATPSQLVGIQYPENFPAENLDGDGGVLPAVLESTLQASLAQQACRTISSFFPQINLVATQRLVSVRRRRMAYCRA